MADPRDKIQYVFNPFTGKLEAVKTFNADRIVTNSLNGAGHPRLIWDAASSSFIADGPDIVVDNDGNVVTTR